MHGFLVGTPAAFFMFACLSAWVWRSVKQYEELLAAECRRLPQYSAKKAGHKVSDEGIAIGRKLAVKDHTRLSEYQKDILHFYHRNALGTGQATNALEHAPPDDSGKWNFVPEDPDGLVWHRNDGLAKSVGAPSSSPAFTG